MRHEKATLINYRIQRAYETIDEAKLALDNGRLQLAAKNSITLFTI